MKGQLENKEPLRHEWTFPKKPINPLLLSSLADRWPKAESMYTITFCEAFRYLRGEREAIWQYVYNRRYTVHVHVNVYACMYYT